MQKMYRCLFISLFISCYHATLSTSLPPAFYQRKAWEFWQCLNKKLYHIHPAPVLCAAFASAVRATKHISINTPLENTIGCLQYNLNRIKLYYQKQNKPLEQCREKFMQIVNDIFSAYLYEYFGFAGYNVEGDLLWFNKISPDDFFYTFASITFTNEALGTIFIVEAEKMTYELRNYLING